METLQQKTEVNTAPSLRIMPQSERAASGEKSPTLNTSGSSPAATPGWSPAGRAVLVKTYQREQLSAIIEMPEGYESSMAALEQRAVVVEIGPTAWHDEPQARAKVGDHVLVTKFAGFLLVGDDGVVYRIINDRDVFARKDA